MSRTPPILLIGCGNPARRDDGLGPALVQRLASTPGLEAWWDYQLSIEHAADIAAYELVIIADASETASEPCELREIIPKGVHNYTSHILEPEAVIDLARSTFGWQGHAYVLAIRGYEFDPFVEMLSVKAARNLPPAERQVRELIRRHTALQPGSN